MAREFPRSRGPRRSVVSWFGRLWLKIPRGLPYALGGALSSAALGALIAEAVVYEDNAWPLILSSVVLVAGLILFFFGVREDRWRARRLGYFLSIQASQDQGYELKQMTEQAKNFEQWARHINPVASVLPSLIRQVDTRADVVNLAQLAHAQMDAAEGSGGIHEVTIAYGGRLDAGFVLGGLLRTSAGFTGPSAISVDSVRFLPDSVSVASSSSWCYDDGYAVVAELGEEPTNHHKDPSDRGFILGDGVVPMETHAIGGPEVTWFRRNSGSEALAPCRDADHCEHDMAGAGELLLAVDSSVRPGAMPSRILAAVKESETCSGVRVVGVVTTPGIEESRSAYEAMVAAVEEALAEGQRRCGGPRDVWLALACPAPLSVVLGARLGRTVEWRPLQYSRASKQYEWLLRPRQMPGRPTPVNKPAVQKPPGDAVETNVEQLRPQAKPDAEAQATAVLPLQLLNYTPHETLVYLHPQGTQTLPRQGTARCQENRERSGCLDDDCVLPTWQVTYGDVTGLPDPRPGVVLVVSQITAQALPSRRDLVFPLDFVRENGEITGFKKLAQVPQTVEGP